ncbi:MAG: aminoacyl-tRNA hydrolase [Desulfuromusa sp.]|nr:aminoacyl-tRNA hydrolase [Desulfuromusa sp.]
MTDLQISDDIIISGKQIEITAIRSQGAGGQNVNKVSTGIHLRFDIPGSSLPDELKQRLLQSSDHRINKDGAIIIKSQQTRSQEQNRLNALDLLQTMIQSAMITQKPRKKSRPSRSSMEKRIGQKKQRGRVKELRQKVTD